MRNKYNQEGSCYDNLFDDPVLKHCDKMTLSPFAGAYGLCLLKHPQGNDYKTATCDFIGKDDYTTCPLLEQQKYEEMCAAISSEEMED